MTRIKTCLLIIPIIWLLRSYSRISIDDFAVDQNEFHKITVDQIKEYMLGLDLDPDSKIKVKNYSLGMYQKLAIIQAVMEDPNVIIFDEPFNGLDKKSFGIVKQMIVGLKGKGRIVLITSHILSDIQEVADEVYEFDNKQNTPLVC